MKSYFLTAFFCLILSGCGVNLAQKQKLDPQIEQISDAIYLHNQGEHKKALRKFENYAREGNVEAMYQAGVYHRDGTAGRKDFERAKFWFEAAGYFGHVEALRNVGALYEYGLGTRKDLKKAREFYLKAAKLGSHLAAYELAHVYKKQRKFKDARVYLERACGEWVMPACEELENLQK